MSIETKLISNGKSYSRNNADEMVNMLTEFGFYNWVKMSVTRDNSAYPHITGKFYFTENDYLEIYLYSGNSYSSLYVPRITVVFSDKSYVIRNGEDNSYNLLFAIGKTSKGIALSLHAYQNSNDDVYTSTNFNYFIGDIRTMDGTITKGVLYSNSYTNAGYTVYTKDGISTESEFIKTIDNTKQLAYLIPATDSTHGFVFNDIFMIKNSPINRAILKVSATNRKYLCGENFCIGD